MRNALKPVPPCRGSSLLACAAPLPPRRDFEWRGQMASGQTIEIKGVNGNVRAMAAAATRSR